jgi:hypothetical protein
MAVPTGIKMCMTHSCWVTTLKRCSSIIKFIVEKKIMSMKRPEIETAWSIVWRDHYPGESVSKSTHRLGFESGYVFRDAEFADLQRDCKGYKEEFEKYLTSHTVILGQLNAAIPALQSILGNATYSASARVEAYDALVAIGVIKTR